MYRSIYTAISGFLFEIYSFRKFEILTLIRLEANIHRGFGGFKTTAMRFALWCAGKKNTWCVPQKNTLKKNLLNQFDSPFYDSFYRQNQGEKKINAGFSIDSSEAENAPLVTEG